MNTVAFEPFANISRDRTQAAKAWKQSGGRVVGYLSNNIPLEIIHAAGMLPFHLIADPDQGNELANQFMEPAFDSITRSVLNRLLKGDFDFVDLIVLPRTNDAQQRLYYYLCELKRKYPQFKLPPVYLLNLLHSPKESTAAHNARKVKEFADFMAEHFSGKNRAGENALEKKAGHELSEQKLQAAIATYNRAREQLQAFTELRARPDRDVPSTLAHQVYAGAQSLPIEDFTGYLAELVDALQAASPAQSMPKRFVLAGNGLDHPALHQWADELGACIAGDYHSLGNHFLVSRVDDSIDPLTALSQHYHRHTRSCRSFFDNPNAVVDFAREQQASGILFFYLDREEALTWHYPQQHRAARNAGLHTLALREQAYQLDTKSNLASVREFLEKL